MKTSRFLFWISILVLFPHLFSKSITDKDQYNESNENYQDAGEKVAFHESFRPRHKYKSSGHQTRFYRSDSESNSNESVKTLQCAVMYKDNEPVGILQPFKDSYRFLPVTGDSTLVDINPVPVKRKTIMDVLYPNKINQDYNEDMAENNNQFADDRYPSIFAKFKIDSRLDKTLNPDLNMKRSMYKRDKENDSNEDQASPLKTTLSKINGDNSEVVEEELKSILDDMGLIEDYGDKEEAKRDVAEDEDMEQGTNKISLVKEERNETRNKRGDTKATTEDGLNSSTIENLNTTTVEDVNTTETTTTTSAIVPTKARFEEERTDEVDSIDLFKNDEAKISDDSNEDSDDSSTENNLEQMRKKRKFEENTNQKRDATDTLPDVNLNTSSLVQETELNQYEKRVEREIRDKIKKLKEEVREEIENLKKNPQVNNEQTDVKRKKRQVINTLLDEETRDIDPNLDEEEPREEHHVRRKRSVNDAEIKNQKVHLTNLKNTSVDATKKNIVDMLTVIRKKKYNTDKTPRTKRVIRYNTSKRDKRFIGINPILENVNDSLNNNIHWNDFNLKNAMGDFRYRNSSLINTNNFTTRYKSRSLKQFDENLTKEISLHVRVKRSDTNDSNTAAHTRRRRQYSKDLEKNDYQYDDLEFNKSPAVDKEQNDNQPYTDENSVAGNFGSSNINSNCNCDKSDTNCKCGSQKNDVSVPNMKEDYSEYMESPSVDLEKKSIHHCKCSKDGKHCNCQSFGEGSQYSDYAEEPSVSLDNSGVLEELQERAPRKPRQGIDLAEDYYNDYEDDTLTKREAKFRSGEYFVDLHPDVYRLTPVDTSRDKRESFKDLIAAHGGAPVLNHLVAIRQRSMLPHPRIRRRVQGEDNREPRQLIDMSDEDIFGALPQSFAGELTRYKRVKRDESQK